MKIRFSDFSTITRSRTQKEPYTYHEIKPVLMDLLPLARIRDLGVRLLGATMSNFHIEQRKSNRQFEIDFGTEDDLDKGL